MHNYNGNGSRAASARGFVALSAVLAMGLALMASPAEAAPFAYVTNYNDGTVSVIDTATNMVVTTVAVGPHADGVAVSPDGKHAYVASQTAQGNVSVIDTGTNTVVATVLVGVATIQIAVTPDGKHAYVTNGGGGATNTVEVIDTATNTVVATVAVGNTPAGVAVTPDGKHVYVTNSFSNNVSVIATATNTVVATVAVGPGGAQPYGVAITPDGKHVYVVNNSSNNVSVIDTATNMVEAATIPVGNEPGLVAITPDGTHAYVTNFGSNNVSVIDTATNMVAATIALPANSGPSGVAVTPDGTHAYVTDTESNNVSVIDTASNTVVTTVGVGNEPFEVGIIPDVPFLAFSAALEIHFGSKPNTDAFALESSFTLSRTAPTIDPVTQPVTLQAGTFATTIPPSSFKKIGGLFTFAGVISGVSLQALITPTGTLRYAFVAAAEHANLTGTMNPVTVRVSIGNNSGTTPVTAVIFHY